EHEAVRIVLERQNALGAQDRRTVLRNQILDPRKELVGIERLVGRDRDRLHLLVVIMLQALAVVVMVVAMVVMMVMIVVMMIVIMRVVVIILAMQEIRLDIEDAVEIEGLAVQHFVKRDLRALGAVQ